jgi:hypothetical protein
LQLVLKVSSAEIRVFRGSNAEIRVLRVSSAEISERWTPFSVRWSQQGAVSRSPERRRWGGCRAPRPATAFSTGTEPVGVPVAANGWRCSKVTVFRGQTANIKETKRF